MYGQTETSPRMSYFDLTKYPKKIESIGKPLRNTKFEIYKNELIFTGDNVSLGYAKKLIDLQKGDENKGKIKTGDLGFKDNENFYFLTGRKKRISKLFGLRINLDDIENTLKKNDLNAEAIINDNKIKIKSSNLNEHDKIKSIIFHKFKINKNYIEVINNINLEKKRNFKNLI
jgi:long-subunit acyl-CoA synthetase (AMP-forming)